MWRTKKTVDPDDDWRDLASDARKILEQARLESKEDARLLVDAVSRRDNVKIRLRLDGVVGSLSSSILQAVL